jgi:hypothetical protein
MSTGDKNMRILAPRLIDDLLLVPHVRHFPTHGWRAEVCFTGARDGDRDGVVLGEFFATQAESHADAMRTVETWPSP